MLQILRSSRILLISILFPIFLSTNSFAGDKSSYANYKYYENSKWKGYFDTNLKYGNHRNLGRVDLFLPFIETEDSLTFFDFRVMLDDNGSKEGNFGLGYRKLYDDYIWGAYGFFDRRESENDNKYGQVTLGTELLTEKWDFRTNYYISDGKEHVVNDGTTYLTGTGIVRNVMLATSIEKSMSGFDFEVGRVVPKFENLSLFGSLYHFYDSDNDLKNMNGARVRSEYKVNDIVSLEYEASYDNIRDDTHFAGLRLRYEFGGKGGTKHNLSPLEKRMTNKIVRDIDIVTELKESNERYSENGNFINALVIDDGATHNADDIEALSSENDYIYVTGSSSVAGSLQLKDGQKLFGEHSGLNIAGTQIFNQVDNSRPIFSNSGSSQNIIQLANDNVVSGIEIDGTGQTFNNANTSNGIYIFNVDNFAVDDVVIQNVAGSGIRNRFTVAGDYSGSLENNIISSSGTNGISVDVRNASVNVAFENISNNDVQNNGDNGFIVESRSGAILTLENMTNNVASNNSDRGIFVASYSGATMNVDNIDSNVVENNSGIGISLTSNGGTSVFGSVSDNTVQSNGSYGISVNNANNVASSMTVGEISENAVNNNTTNGIRLLSSNGPTFNIGSVDSNSVDNNGVGIFIRNNSGIANSFDVAVTNNELSNNTTAIRFANASGNYNSANFGYSQTLLRDLVLSDVSPVINDANDIGNNLDMGGNTSLITN